MKNYHIIYIVLFVLLGFTSCDEGIILDVDQAPPQVVIDGLITTDDTTHYVKLSRTKFFYDKGSTQRIVNATVIVQDDLGNTYNFSHNPMNEQGLRGYYLSDVSFAGVVGATYTLTVTVDGESYKGIDELLPVTTIDSLTYEIDPDAYEYHLEEYETAKALYEQALETDDSVLISQAELYLEEATGIYAVFFNAKEPQGTVDYYKWDFYRNGKIARDSPNDIYIAEDEFVGEEIDHLEIPSYYALGDTVTTVMYSISRTAFVYYSDLVNVLNNDGGMFSPIPANPRNNLSNGALGYFQTSAVDRASVIIKE